MKKVVAGLLAIMLAVGGLYVVPMPASEVQAAEAEVALEKGVALRYTEDSTSAVTYDITVANPLPVPVSETYQDYLFAGWFKESSCTADNAVSMLEMAEAGVESGYYAKFVPRDTLDVKFQIANGTITDTDENGNPINKTSAIRFISSVDSLDYQAIGFEVSGYENPYSSSTVYEKIDSTMTLNGAKKEYTFSPKVIGTESEYFFTAKLGVAADDATDYTVKAYWITLDGTKVYGDQRVVSLQDGNENVLNLTVKGTVSGTTATVTNYTSATGKTYTSAATATVLGTTGSNTQVRVVLDGTKTVDGLTSAAVVAIGDAKGIYRNYNTSHTSGTTTAPGSDVSWYYAELALDESATEFVIATSADLYGMAYLVDYAVTAKSQITCFPGATITLISDITVNEEKPVSTGFVGDTYAWNPAGSGNDTYVFNGTFDGDHNTISGLDCTSASYAGLFAQGGASAEFKNVNVVNSWFTVTSTNYAGSVVAFNRANRFENIYSNSIIVVAKNTSQVGGIVGRWRSENKEMLEMSNCWFDGEIHATGGNANIGGLVGNLFWDYAGETFKNCMYTGSISYNYTGSASPYVGGLFGNQNTAGSSTNDYKNRTVKYENCLIAGSIVVKHDSYAAYTGKIAGYVGYNAGYSVDNCYSLCDVNYVNSSNIATAITKCYGTMKATVGDYAKDWTITDDGLLSGLVTSDGVWQKVDGNELPVLSQFKDVWLSTQIVNQ